MNKLAEKFEKKILEEKLRHAMEKHPGIGLNVLNNKQHYGWYRWDGKKHIKFSIDDFKDAISVKKLEDVVRELKVIKLEDY